MARRRRQHAGETGEYQASLLTPSTSRFKVDYLAGMIATWRYGDKPSKAERDTAAELAQEFAERIEALP